MSYLQHRELEYETHLSPLPVLTRAGKQQEGQEEVPGEGFRRATCCVRGCHRCVAGQIGRYYQAHFAAVVQRVNARGCSFVSSVPFADGQGRAVFTGSFARESFQDAIRHCEGRGFTGQEGKRTVRCQTGARQGEV